MARNVQLWTEDGHLLLDGSPATAEEIKQALRTVEAGGLFGYRFHSPAMRVGTHAVYWHRPLAAYRCPNKQVPTLLSDAPLGYLTAYPTAPHRRQKAGEMVSPLIEPETAPLPRRRGAKTPDALTYGRTARRAFEVTYWKTIVVLAESKYLNKNNADCVRDARTQCELPYFHRQLDALGDFLLGYYDRHIAAAKLKGKAAAGALPLQWRTDFDFSWMGGWLMNQEQPAERNILVRIPGQDRSRAVIMADHYDTAYMADRYEKQAGGRGARVAACGA